MEINTLEKKKIKTGVFVVPKTVIEIKCGDKWGVRGAETIIIMLIFILVAGTKSN